MSVTAKPWDLVTLKDHTSVYRVYTLPNGALVYCCLYADVLRWATSPGVEVSEIVEDAPDALTIRRLTAENEYLKSHLQMHSPNMGGQHSWRFRAGWPITSARGATPDDAVVHAMQLVAQSKADAAKGA